MELTFGEQIKIILKRKNMTIRQLAELMEVQTGKPMSRQNLTQKLNRDNFQEQDMKEIAQAIGCTVKISVMDSAEAAASSIPNTMISQGADPVREPRPAGAKEEKLAEEEAAVTRQPLPEPMEEDGDVNADVLKEIETALMESLRKELYSEEDSAGAAEKQEKAGKRTEKKADTLSWARKKPLVWPTLTVPGVTARKAEETLPSAEDETLIDAGTLQDAETPPSAGELEEELPAAEPLSEAELSSEGALSSEAEEAPSAEGVPEAEERSELPFEEELFSDLEDIPMTEEADDLEDLEDLEFFDLEDFYGGEISQVSAPYAVKREEEAQAGNEGLSEEAPPEAEAAWEAGSFDTIPEGGGDVSFASAPYVIPREPKQPAEEPMADGSDEETDQKEPKTGEETFRTPGSFTGSKGDISSVSAPYVIPREPEEAPPSKPMGERGYWQDVEEEEQEDWAAVTPGEWNEEPEEEPLSPDMEEKIASWDAAVKRRLENPFLRSLERRARRAAEGIKNQTEEIDTREEEEGKKEEENGQTVEESRRKEAEEEILDLQGPAINPLTGTEYETNTVKHHPTQPDMLLVYDKDEHRWIVQAERAFLNFQINKRALLGKDYEPPLYLD